MNEYELYHYGVKGMKWGVRRAIGKQARSYARDYYTNKKLTKKSSRLDSKLQKMETKISKLRKKKRGLDERISDLSETMKSKASGLSEKDIRQGKREVVAGKVAKTALTMSLTAASIYAGSSVTTRTVIATLSPENAAALGLKVIKLKP